MDFHSHEWRHQCAFWCKVTLCQYCNMADRYKGMPDTYARHLARLPGVEVPLTPVDGGAELQSVCEHRACVRADGCGLCIDNSTCTTQHLQTPRAFARIPTRMADVSSGTWSRLFAALVHPREHLALANQYSFVSLLKRQTTMLSLTAPSGLMVTSKVARLVTGRASTRASDAFRSAVILTRKAIQHNKPRRFENESPSQQVQRYAGTLRSTVPTAARRYVHVYSIQPTDNLHPATDKRHTDEARRTAWIGGHPRRPAAGTVGT
jgi:hypothetical protein